MNKGFQLHHIPLSSIELKNKTFFLSLWDTQPSEDLLTSIKRYGILHPPILLHQGNMSYSIVAGRKRIQAAKQLAPSIPVACHVLPAETPLTTIFSILLEEAANTKPLTVTEQIIFFEKLLDSSPIEEALPMLGQIGHEPQQHVLENLLELRSLNNQVLKALHQGTLSEKNARKLLNLSEVDQIRLIKLITDLRLGGSKQRKLIDLGTELIMRENTSLENILSEFPQTDETGQPKNIPQQSSALLSWLQNRCLPQSSQAEKNFKRQVSSLNLPPSMEVRHTPSFEDKKISLILRFPDWQSFDATIEVIKKLMQ